MVYTAKHSVQDMINRRIKRNEKHKVKFATTENIEVKIENIIEKFNARYAGLSTSQSKYLALEDLQQELGTVTHSIDKDVDVSVNWYKNELDDLILQSVTINWSEACQLKYNLCASQNINLGNKCIREMLGG